MTYNRYRDFKWLVEMYNYGRWYDPEIEKLRVQLSRDEHRATSGVELLTRDGQQMERHFFKSYKMY